MNQQSVSATELSKMAYCEYNVIRTVRPGKQDRLRMKDGIREHNRFEGMMNHLGDSRICVSTQQTPSTKTTNLGRPTFPYKTFIVLFVLLAIAYLYVTG